MAIHIKSLQDFYIAIGNVCASKMNEFIQICTFIEKYVIMVYINSIMVFQQTLITILLMKKGCPKPGQPFL